MARAAAGLKSRPAIFLIDGLPVPGFPHPSRAIVKGDSISLSIAAASIIAKVTRDREMAKLDAEYPAYGFAKHQGYGTREHLAALQRHGPCPHHRRSFRPVSQLELPFDTASG
jgi:ribonuclease HII